MDNRAVGIFDSGLGGLTAVRVLKSLMPDENIIYFGDTGRMPYGGRPPSQIRLICRQNLAFVESFGVKAILAACGTVSSNAKDILDSNPVKSMGVLTAGVRELAGTGLKRLGVIATKTSIESGAFQAEIQRLRPDAEVIALACPEFVPMIEGGHYDPKDPLVADTVRRSLSPLKDAEIGALLLGCTHYGIIGKAIENCLGADVKLIGAADAAARAMRDYLTENGMTAESGGTELYCTSGSAADFLKLSPIMLGSPVKGEIRYVPPMKTEE